MKRNVCPATLGELLKAHEDYIARARSTGARILSFKTPCCGGSVETIVPNGKETWDSLTTCPHCGILFMKICRHEKVIAVAVPSEMKSADGGVVAGTNRTTSGWIGQP